MQVHIGKRVEAAWQASGMSAAEFAKRIGQHRQNVRDIFGRATMDTGLLMTISAALGVDFFTPYSEALGLTEAPVAQPPADVPAQVAALELALTKSQAELAAAQREIGYLQEIVALLRQRPV